MTQADQDQRIDYIEFNVSSVAAAKAFYGSVFDWKFTDYGEDYASFFDGRLNGGFRQMENPPRGGPLVVIYAVDLGAAQRKVEQAGGVIVVAPFEFPGGRRFQFTDPSGNELAVWSDR